MKSRELEMRRSFICVAALMGIAGCAGRADPVGEAEKTASEIINGTVIPAEGSGVVNLGNCSGTLLTNDYVMTATHCGASVGRQISMGSQSAVIDTVWNQDGSDVTLLRLDRRLTMNGSQSGYFLPVRADKPTVGETVTCRGYGYNAYSPGWGTGFGTLRSAQLPIIAVSADSVTTGPNASNQIQWKGDSGSTCIDQNGRALGAASTCSYTYSPPLTDPPNITGITSCVLSEPANLAWWVDSIINVKRDFNADRKTDFLWHNGTTGATAVWFMNGATMASQAPLDPRYPVLDANGFGLVGAGDFNYDGRSDILWHNGTTGVTAVWFMDGVTMASQAPLDPRYPVLDANGYRFAGTGDFNYDGRTDILWHNGTTGATAVWFMNGVTMASQAPLDPRYPVLDANGYRFAGTGDFNYDGRTDILWHNGTTGATAVWFMDGVTMTSQAPLDPRYPVLDANGFRFAGTGDFNYDGKTDIVWHNGTSGLTVVWYMDGVTMTNQSAFGPLVYDSNGFFPAGNQ